MARTRIFNGQGGGTPVLFRPQEPSEGSVGTFDETPGTFDETGGTFDEPEPVK
jgi:hypothetical protein